MHTRKPAGSSVLLLITLLFFSLVLPLSATVSAAPAPAATSPNGSSDLNTNDGDTIFIQYLSNKDIMKGFPDGSFRPQEGLTRAQAATLLIKAAGIAPASVPSKFKDLKADHWAYASIAAAEKAGFISGFPDGTFHPEEGLTRAQGISLALRLSKQSLNTAALPALADMNSQHWAAPAVATGLAAQMVALSADGKSFLPNAPFSRGNMARALGILLTQDPGLYAATLTGTLKVTSGTATLQSGTGDPVTVNNGSTANIKTNDVIITGAGCTADLSYPDGSSMLLKEKSTVSVQEAQGRHYIKSDGHEGVGVDYLNLKIKEGTLFGAVATTHTETAAADSSNKTSQLKTNYYASLNRPQLLAAADQPWYEASKTKKVKVKVDMPWGVAAIRGTFVMINVASNGQSNVSCLTGSAEVSSGGASVPLSQGQASAVTSQGAPPAASTTLSTAVVQAFAAVKAWVEQVAQAMDNAQPATIAPPAPAVVNPALAPAVAAPVNTPAAVNPAAAMQTVQSAMSATGVTTAASSPASSTPSSGSSGSPYSGVTTTNTAPTATAVIISDSSSGAALTTAPMGTTLYGQYTYTDTESDVQGISLCQWYRGSQADGSDKTAISGATTTSYTTDSADVGQYLFYQVTPVAATGTLTGTAVLSSALQVIAPVIPPASSGIIDLLSSRLDLRVSSCDGHFTLGTAAGTSLLTSDDSKSLIFGWNGASSSTGTSQTTIQLDGTNKVFGLDGSWVSNPQNAAADTNRSTYSYANGSVQVDQELQLQGNQLIMKYTLRNNDTAAHNIGVRIMLDTMVGGNDSCNFRVNGRNLQTWASYAGSNIPANWYSFDSLSTQPNVIAQGQNLLSQSWVPDKFLIGSYDTLFTNLWDYAGSGPLGDSAVAMFWNPVSLAAGATLSCSMSYGVVADDAQFIRYMNSSVPALISSASAQTVTVNLATLGIPSGTSAAISLIDPVNTSIANTTASIDSNGAASATLTIPASLAAGPYYIRATAAGQTIEIPFTITGTPPPCPISALSVKIGDPAVGNNLLSNFNSSTLSYLLGVADSVYAVTIAPTLASGANSVVDYVYGGSNVPASGGVVPLYPGLNTAHVVVSQSGVSQTYTLNIQRLNPGTANVGGYVYAANGTTPISGASVRVHLWGDDDVALVSGGSDVCTTTDANGLWYLTNIPPGSYRIKAEAASKVVEYYVYGNTASTYVWNDVPVLILDGGQTLGNINFQLDAGGTISGTVTSSASGNPPIDGIKVFAQGPIWYDSLTLSNGSYTITGLPFGQYTILAPRYITDPWVQEWYDNQTTVANATPVTISAGTPNATGIDFILTPMP